MNSKPIVPRQFANQDVDEAIEYYVDEGATDAALGFIDELERAYNHIAQPLDHADLRSHTKLQSFLRHHVDTFTFRLSRYSQLLMQFR